MLKLIILTSLFSSIALPCATKTSLENEYSSIATVAEHLTAERSIASEGDKEEVKVIYVEDDRLSYREFIQKEEEIFGDNFSEEDFPKDTIAKVRLVHIDPRTGRKTVIINGTGVLVGKDRVITSKHLFSPFLDFYGLNSIEFDSEGFIRPNRSNPTLPELPNGAQTHPEYERALDYNTKDHNLNSNGDKDLRELLKRHSGLSRDLENIKVEFLFGYDNGSYTERRIAKSEIAGSGYYATHPDHDLDPTIKRRDLVVGEYVDNRNRDTRFSDWTVLKLDKEVEEVSPLPLMVGFPINFQTGQGNKKLAGTGIGFVSIGYAGDRNDGGSLSINPNVKITNGPLGEGHIYNKQTFLQSTSTASSGMSGGPLFARRINPNTNKMEYHLVGIVESATNKSKEKISSETVLYKLNGYSRGVKGLATYSNMTREMAYYTFATNPFYNPKYR